MVFTKKESETGKNFKKYLLPAYVIGSFVIFLLLISFFVFRSFSQTYMQRGYAFAVEQIMAQASQCQQVELFSGETKIHMVSVECLQKAQAGNQTNSQTPPAEPAASGTEE